MCPWPCSCWCFKNGNSFKFNTAKIKNAVGVVTIYCVCVMESLHRLMSKEINKLLIFVTCCCKLGFISSEVLQEFDGNKGFILSQFFCFLLFKRFSSKSYLCLQILNSSHLKLSFFQSLQSFFFICLHYFLQFISLVFVNKSFLNFMHPWPEPEN